MDWLGKLIDRVPWGTLPPWAVIAVVVAIVVGACVWARIRSRKKPNTDVRIGSGNKRMDAAVTESVRLKVGDGNEDVKIRVDGKR